MNNKYRGEYIDLLKRSINTVTVNPPGNEEVLAKMYVEYLLSKGIEAWTETIVEGRSNFVARLQGNCHDKCLMFCGHMDTVPIGRSKWNFDPFKAEESNGRIYGRGTSDMKSGLSAMVAAMVELKLSGAEINNDIYLLGTAGEEVNCLGAREYVKTHALDNIGLIVIGEPTDCEVATRQKGAVWVKITAYGKTAHSAMPQCGFNAIYYINELINELKAYKNEWESGPKDVLGKSTMSINQICGGTAPNMVADECSILVDFRLLPGQNDNTVKEVIEGILNKFSLLYPDFSSAYTVENYLKPVSTSKSNIYISKAIELNEKLTSNKYKEKGLNFYTDASVLTEKNDLQVIFYGPGEEMLAHKIDESVDIEKYLLSIDFYKGLAGAYVY